LFDDEDFARRLGSAARARVAAEYRAEVFVRRTEEVYEAAVAERRASIAALAAGRI
jgi:glycosyltransferase involved in cell wall biosynthesis